MKTFRRSRKLFPLVSILSVLALSAQAQEPDHHPPAKGAPGRPGVVHPGGPGHPGPMPGRGPQGGHFARGPLPMHNFGGHAYHGRLAWEGGRWHHEMRNGRDGWWWDVGGAWYFYPQPMEGPPAYVSDVEIADEEAGPDGPPGADGYPPPPGPGPGYPPPPVAYAPPPPPPPPPDPAASAVGGAIVGGVLGGLLTGRPGGAVAGAVVGGTTGAIVGAQAAQRPGYYLSQGNCFYKYPSGQYVQVDPRSCY